MTRSKLGAVALLLGAFVLGGVAGGMGVSMAEHDRRPREGRGGREGYVERLNAELHLSPAQQDSIRAILQGSEPAMDSMWREVRPRFDSVRNAIRDRIRTQLTPEQLEQYTEMLERRDREYRQRRSNGRN